MGTFDNTAISRKQRNSVGDQTFCQWRGTNVVKQKIQENKSNTPAQQQQRKRWSKGVDIEVLFEAAYTIGFPGRKRIHSPANAFSSENMKKEKGVFTTEEDGTVTVDYSLITCAKGRLRLPAEINVSYETENNSLTFSITAEEAGVRRNTTDIVYALVVETEMFDSELMELGTRGEGGIKTMELKSGWSATDLAIYVFVVSEDGKKASDSRHLTVE